VTPADILLDDRLSRDRHMHQSAAAAAAAADRLIVMVVVMMNITMGCVALLLDLIL